MTRDTCIMNNDNDNHFCILPHGEGAKGIDNK